MLDFQLYNVDFIVFYLNFEFNATKRNTINIVFVFNMELIIIWFNVYFHSIHEFKFKNIPLCYVIQFNSLNIKIQ